MLLCGIHNEDFKENPCPLDETVEDLSLEDILDVVSGAEEEKDLVTFGSIIFD